MNTKYQCSFTKERDELQELNTRLAYVIDSRNRKYDENNNPIAQYTNAIEDLKNVYHNELDSNKEIIKTLSEENAKLKIDLGNYKAETIELNEKCALLENQVTKLKQQLNKETILRVNCENKIIELKEQLEFHQEITRKEIATIHSSNESLLRRQQFDFDSKLVAELQNLRNKVDENYVKVKEVWEKMSQNKLEEAHNSIKKLNESNTRLKEEIADLRQKSNELEQELESFKFKNTNLNLNIDNLKTKLAEKNEEIEYLKHQNDKITDGKDELQSLNAHLEEEITRFKNALENEEKRLNIDISILPNGKKRKNF